MGDVTGIGSPLGVARRGGGWFIAALLALAIPAIAEAADGGQVLDCIKKVSRESWGQVRDRARDHRRCRLYRRGIGDIGVGGKEFEEKVKVLRECFDKVSQFLSKAKGTEAEAIAASACVGVTNADDPAACMDKVSRKFRHAEDIAAESLAAIACARGNPAQETAVCVDQDWFPSRRHRRPGRHPRRHCVRPVRRSSSPPLDAPRIAWHILARLPATGRKSVCGSNSVVECNLAKVEVGGSNPLSRSTVAPCPRGTCALTAIIRADRVCRRELTTRGGVAKW